MLSRIASLLYDLSRALTLTTRTAESLGASWVGARGPWTSYQRKTTTAENLNGCPRAVVARKKDTAHCPSDQAKVWDTSSRSSSNSPHPRHQPIGSHTESSIFGEQGGETRDLAPQDAGGEGARRLVNAAGYPNRKLATKPGCMQPRAGVDVADGADHMGKRRCAEGRYMRCYCEA